MALENIWEALLSRRSLLDEARQECLLMLDLGKEMFGIVLSALKEPADHEVQERVGRMDKSVNSQQRNVRKKAFQHLATTRGRDLMEGLAVTSMVIDAERIGDYSKNIGELVELLPGRLAFDEYEQHFQEMRRLTLSRFDLTRRSVAESDEEPAREAMSTYDRVSELYSSTLRDAVRGETAGNTVEKRYIGLVLMLQYMKRVAAHLRNISSTVVNPLDSIGYRAAAK
jgi:phosphate transport system protein